ncbi:MAG: hypothetical protein GX660_22130, partial [Clostridiaceae bacterium]|nr:hypothetical protein [Clostridiaceae bacterium]
MVTFSVLRRAGFFIVLMFCVVMLAPAYTYSKPEDDLVVSVKAGFDDVVRVRSYTPFYVNVLNKGNDFTGEAQLLVLTEYGTKMIYAVPFSVPKGSSKEL